MQAMPCYAVAVRSEVFIAPRRAIPAHDVDFRIRTSQCRIQIVQQIEDARIVFVNIARPMITKISIELSQSFRIISVPVPINDVDPLSRMGVKQTKTIGDI